MTSQPYRERLKARMIEIAERIVAEEGLAAVQARRVAQEADCSVGTLYNVFGDLDGLVMEAGARTLKTLGATLETATRGAARGALEDRLLALALAYRDFAFEHTSAWRALFEHQPPTATPAPSTLEAQRRQLLALLEQHIADTVPPEMHGTAARALFGSVHGIVLLAIDKKLGGSDAVETERQLRFVVALLAKGLS